MHHTLLERLIRSLSPVFSARLTLLGPAHAPRDIPWSGFSEVGRDNTITPITPVGSSKERRMRSSAEEPAARAPDHSSTTNNANSLAAALWCCSPIRSQSIMLCSPPNTAPSQLKSHA
jgi:hypothetical protein